MHEDGKERRSIRVPPAVHARVKTLAAQRRITIEDAYEAALVKWLAGDSAEVFPGENLLIAKVLEIHRADKSGIVQAMWDGILRQIDVLVTAVREKR
jgi:predicted HicB family RNase H-like nuclease